MHLNMDLFQFERIIIVTQQIADIVSQKSDIGANWIRIFAENVAQWHYGSFYMYSGEPKLAPLHIRYLFKPMKW